MSLTGVADKIDNGGTCSITSNNPTGSIAAGAAANLGYQCTYTSAPNPSSFTNTATASWDSSLAYTTDNSAQGTATGDFSKTSPNIKDGSVSVTDTLGGKLGTASYTQANPITFKYSKTFTSPTAGCVTVPNTATFTTSDTGATGSASQSVRLYCNTGALTIGFWQNKNGQGIISGTNQGNLQTFLKGFHPFSDAPSTGLAAYVSNIIKAASAGGTSMNPMLRAQTLATALNVYFSDPALGGVKISAPSGPIGNVTIDLTSICKMIDGSGGTATCSGTYQDASPAFGGNHSMTVLQMLQYQNISDPLPDAGAVWYGQNKTTQGLAKDAFDAINNQVAFGP